MTTARERVADFWDEHLATWRPGEEPAHEPLKSWLESYRGTGKGAVDLSHYPDPYVGDLRGERSEPRLVVLGLNPGVGYDPLQGDDGVWTRRVRDQGYSHCFDRSPAEDPASWTGLHGKPSVYWRNLVRFAGRWLEDDGAGVPDILNLELYPWHSAKVQGVMKPPGAILDEHVWQPVGEVDVDEVFAFGAVWFDVCDAQAMPLLATYGGPVVRSFPGGGPWKGWRLSFYRLPSGQTAVVSAQPGYAGPPAKRRLDVMRTLLGRVDR